MLPTTFIILTRLVKAASEVFTGAEQVKASRQSCLSDSSISSCFPSTNYLFPFFFPNNVLGWLNILSRFY